MKYILIAIVASLITLTGCAKLEPVKALPVPVAVELKALPVAVELKAVPVAVELTAVPVAVEAVKEAPKTKRVCKDSKDKSGNVIKNKDGSTNQVCKTIKIHKKHEGTKVPEKTKK
jgi:hypothetical protein